LDYRHRCHTLHLYNKFEFKLISFILDININLILGVRTVEDRGFESPVRSSQKLKNWHLLPPKLVFTIEGLDQRWLAQYQFK